MTIPVSTAPAARMWLFNALTAGLLPDPADPASALLVCLDEPGTFQPADIVSVGKVTRQLEVSSIVGSGGAGWLKERYTIDVQIEAARGGDNARLAFERASALVDQVVAVVRSDPTMGGNVLWARPALSTCEVLWQDDHQGRVGSADLEISCFQRI